MDKGEKPFGADEAAALGFPHALRPACGCPRCAAGAAAPTAVLLWPWSRLSGHTGVRPARGLCSQLGLSPSRGSPDATTYLDICGERLEVVRYRVRNFIGRGVARHHSLAPLGITPPRRHVLHALHIVPIACSRGNGELNCVMKWLSNENISALELGTRSSLRMGLSHEAEGKCSLVGGLPSAGVLASWGWWPCPLQQGKVVLSQEAVHLIYLMAIRGSCLCRKPKLHRFLLCLKCNCGSRSWAGIHGRCSPDFSGMTATCAGASHDSRKMWRGQHLVSSRRESLQRVTRGHQNQPFCISEVLVGKTQFVSQSDRSGRADAGVMGREQAAGKPPRAEWAVSTKMSIISLPCLWERCLHLGGEILPWGHWFLTTSLITQRSQCRTEIRDRDPCSWVRSCKRGRGLGQGRQGTGCPWAVKTL